MPSSAWKKKSDEHGGSRDEGCRSLVLRTQRRPAAGQFRTLWCGLFPGRTAGLVFCVFFFNDTATTEIYTLSLHDALPIYSRPCHAHFANALGAVGAGRHTG